MTETFLDCDSTINIFVLFYSIIIPTIFAALDERTQAMYLAQNLTSTCYSMNSSSLHFYLPSVCC